MTLAVATKLPPGLTLPGRGALKETEIGGPIIVTLADADFVMSWTETAMMVTEPPVGTVIGGVYVVAELLSVCAGLNEPHEPEGAHDQLTFELLLTAADT